MTFYERGIEPARRPWQRRIEVFSPKLHRRLTLFSQAAHQAWLLLEADPRVKRFCEHPARIEGSSNRVIDFWVDSGRHKHFWLLGSDQEGAAEIPSRAHGLAVRVVRHEDLIAQSVWIQNWARMVPYLVCNAPRRNTELGRELLARLAKPHRLHSLERAYNPIDSTELRATLFELMATGKVSAAELHRSRIGPRTVFRAASR